ncbi:MAG TPA: cytochrome C oxidase subunit IV family protein [Limnochordia bacterium]|nr:cytochrome C oxidase subunit IV family protein [Limnochordia bacterium]
MAQHKASESPHVSTSTYLKVGLVLAVLTALEVAVVYVESLKGIVAFLLLLIGIMKFALVAMYFMHLKFDTPVYSRFFMVGLVLALACMLAVMAIMRSDRATTLLLSS